MIDQFPCGRSCCLVGHLERRGNTLMPAEPRRQGGRPLGGALRMTGQFLCWINPRDLPPTRVR